MQAYTLGPCSDRGSVMVWGVCCLCGLGQHIALEGRVLQMNSYSYQIYILFTLYCYIAVLSMYWLISVIPCTLFNAAHWLLCNNHTNGYRLITLHPVHYIVVVSDHCVVCIASILHTVECWMLLHVALLPMEKRCLITLLICMELLMTTKQGWAGKKIWPGILRCPTRRPVLTGISRYRFSVGEWVVGADRIPRHRTQIYHRPTGLPDGSPAAPPPPHPHPTPPPTKHLWDIWVLIRSLAAAF